MPKDTRDDDHDRIIRLEEGYAILKALVYGLVGLILTAVVGAVLSLILKGP